MPNLGGLELVAILAIVLLLFGGAKLPKLARSLREAKDEFEGGKDDPKALSKREAKSLKNGASRDADDDKVTLSKSELDALLAERELKAKQD